MNAKSRFVSINSSNWSKVGEKLNVIDSTSDELQRRLQKLRSDSVVIPSGFSIRANEQTKGRGQFNRVWESSPGQNLAVSFYFKPSDFFLEKSFLISQAVAICLCEVIQKKVKGKLVQLKWPNDILVGGKKIAGVLIENSIKGDKILHSIIGIGLNVNQSFFSDAITGTSIFIESGIKNEVDEIWKDIALNLQIKLTLLQEMIVKGDVYDMQRAYHTLMFGLNQKREFFEINSGKKFLATVKGVTSKGLLRLHNDTSDESHFSLGEIKFVL